MTTAASDANAAGVVWRVAGVLLSRWRFRVKIET